MEPRILVLDESSAGLDPRGRRELIALLRTFDQQTMLISTHDMRLAYNCACVGVDGAANAILNNADLMERHGLERPYSV